MGLLHLNRTPKINFIGLRLITFGLSLFMVGVIFMALLFKGLPLGVDFKGGILLELRLPSEPVLRDVRQKLLHSVQGDVVVQTLGNPHNLLIRLEHGALKDTKEAVNHFVTDIFQENAEVRRIEIVGPKVSQELLSKGLWAILFSLLAMLVYIWFRFEWKFGLAALLALLHDCVGVLGVYVLGRVEFNEAAIVAFLVTASYSINDTVVVFDRVRENMEKNRLMPLKEVLNLSVNETLSRTLLTSLTTLAALFSLYFFGGPVIASFSLPILVGLIVGTYSSVCLSSPLLFLMRKEKDKKVA